MEIQNQEYGKDNYFIISEEDKIIAKGGVGNRLIIGFKANVKDAFGDIVPVEAIFYQPTVAEIKEFTKGQIALQRNLNDVDSAFAFMNKWFKKMIVFPAIQTEAGVGLSNFLEYYPMIAGDFLRSLFEPHINSQIEDEESRKKKEEVKLLESFRV